MCLHTVHKGWVHFTVGGQSLSAGVGRVWPLPRTQEAVDSYYINIEMFLLLVFYITFIYLFIYLFVYLLLWCWGLNSEESFVLENFYLSIHFQINTSTALSCVEFALVLSRCGVKARINDD